MFSFKKIVLKIKILGSQIVSYHSISAKNEKELFVIAYVHIQSLVFFHL